MSTGQGGSLPLDAATLDAVQALEEQLSRDALTAARDALYQWRRSLPYGRPWGQREIDEARAVEALASRIEVAAAVVEGWL